MKETIKVYQYVLRGEALKNHLGTTEYSPQGFARSKRMPYYQNLPLRLQQMSKLQIREYVQGLWEYFKRNPEGCVVEFYSKEACARIRNNPDFIFLKEDTRSKEVQVKRVPRIEVTVEEPKVQPQCYKINPRTGLREYS